MKISLHMRVSTATLTQALNVNEGIDASELCEVLRAKALIVWNDGCQGLEIKSGKLEAGITYHVIAHNRERTRKILKTLSKIHKL